MTIELLHNQPPRKYGTGPGSNSRPLDLLPNVLQGSWTGPTKIVPDLGPNGLQRLSADETI